MASGSAVGQEAGRVDVDQVLLVGEDSSHVIALVSVTDGDGRPVTGLTQFETLIDDVAVTPDSISSAVDENAGVAVLLLVDASGSMAGNPIAQAQAAVTTFIEELGANDRAAIIPFGSEVPTEAEFLTREDLTASTAGLVAEQANQGTALYSSIERVLATPWQTELSRRALVLLTDGQDSAQLEGQREAALEAARLSGLPVFTIGLGDGADTGFLDELAGASSGTSYFAPEPNDVLQIFDTIAVTLRSQYVVTVPLIASDSVERELTIRVSLPDANLSTRTTFATGTVDEGLPTGTPMISLAAGIAGVVILLVVIVWLVFARRPARKQDSVPSSEDLGMRLRDAAPIPPSNGQGASLTVLQGPNAGVAVELSNGVIDIGSSEGSGLRLDASNGAVAGTHARVWLKSGKLMLHHLARKRQTFVGDKSVEWATLEHQDTLQIGPHLIGFSGTTPS
jgi:Mg-chelatase subunit ChlD